MRWLIKRLLLLLAAVCAVLIGAGAYVGNLAYQEFRETAWDAVLGIENHSQDVGTIRRLEQERGWESVRIAGADGTMLRGTYIEDSHSSHRTVILLHGLYQNRSMCLAYVPMYRNMGYNVLLIDQRGHGESGGGHTDWGLAETGDIDRWIQWLHARDSAMAVGLHGVSLGAAMALLYAGTEEGQHAAFVVADSSYGDIVSLGRDKLLAATGDKRAAWGYDIVEVFFEGAMLVHTHRFLSQIEPVQAVRHMRAPVLFLHGDEDKLVPVQAVRTLFAACGSPDKEMYVFAHSPHAAGIETNHEEYRQAVTAFLQQALP